MNSTATKETRTVGKAHKKAQRNKKQQQQQQQQQQQSTQTKTKKEKEIIKKTTTTVTTTIKNNNNNNQTNNNTNNNSNNNSTNIAAKLREHLEAEQRKNAEIISLTTPPVKFERAHSFSLKGRLSKLFNSMTGSKENVSRLPVDNNSDELPHPFTRSRSMILPRRPNRRSFIEPQLEQLSEEAEKLSDTTLSPAKTQESVITAETTTFKVPTTPRTPTKSTTSRVPNTTSSTPLAELHRGASLLSLSVGKDKTDASQNPQLNFQRRRSSTLIGSFRSTLAGLIGGNEAEQRKKKEKLYPKWSASLQSLQAIDNMVSYDNMSFIDYDKLNAYEKHLEKQLSTLNLASETMMPVHACMTSSIEGQLQFNNNNNNPYIANPLSTSASLHASNHSFNNSNNSGNVVCQLSVPSESSPALLVRRRHKSLSNRSLSKVNQMEHETRLSYNLDSDYEHNYDKSRNVYRDSLDSRKLELINDFLINLNVPKDHIVDTLNLEVQRPLKRRASISSASFYVGDELLTDNHFTPIKSKSLTHLDGLDRTVTYQHGDKSANCITPLTQNIVGGENNIISATTNAAGKLNHTESGTEYFQISFYGDANVLEDDELIPVKKGMKLCNALNPSLKKRNLSFSKIAIIDQSELIDSDKPVQTLDKNTSVEHLAGHHLVVTQQDYRKTTLQKAASFGAGTRPSRLLSSASTEETSEQTLNSSSKVKNRWSGLFGVRNAQYAQLCDLLNTFSRTGVPQQPETILYLEHPSFADAMQYLSNMHNSWTDFIDYKNMSENDKKIQTAIWELVTTEVFYIQTLQTVTNLFLACLLSVQEYNILKDVDQNKLFSNVREICFANLRFWTMSLYPMVAHSVATKEPMRIIFFQQGFASFGALFTPYKRYCAEQSTCQYYCKELYRTNVLFTSYLAWCESHKMCNRLRLADILVRPMQRLTKYSLLLTAIRKQLYSIHEVELVDFMIQSVENFVCSVNSHLTIRQEHERLKGVMARIESYDVVPETNNEHLDRMLKQFSRMFDLCMPMKGCPAHHVRHLFMEGDHKYKDYTGKHDVHCFLMTDMLMVCKAASRKTVGQLKVIRQPYITDRLVVHLQNNVLSCVYLNEYQVAVSAFTLTCLEARSWYDSLKRARNIYTRLKQSVLNMTPSTASHNVPSAPFTTEYANYGTPYAYPQMFSNSNSTMAADGSVTGTSLAATESVVCCIPPEGLDSTSAVTSTDPLGIMFRKSPLSSSSVCSHISSTNASKSGSVEWNESRNISVEMEKTNSLSSDDGVTNAGAHGVITALIQGKHMITGHKSKAPTTTSLSSLSLQPPVIGHLGQSLPNLTTHQSHTNLYHTYSNNTLLVPGTSSTHSGNLLLSPSHRGISYPPPSPTRVPLRRGFAFSTSMKNPPLVKTRNITSQNSSSWRHMFSSSIQPTATTTTTVAASGTIPSTTNPPSPTHAPYIYTTTSIAETPCSKLTTTPLLLTNDDIAEETVDHSLDD